MVLVFKWNVLLNLYHTSSPYDTTEYDPEKLDLRIHSTQAKVMLPFNARNFVRRRRLWSVLFLFGSPSSKAFSPGQFEHVSTLHLMHRTCVVEELG